MVKVFVTSDHPVIKFLKEDLVEEIIEEYGSWWSEMGVCAITLVVLTLLSVSCIFHAVHSIAFAVKAAFFFDFVIAFIFSMVPGGRIVQYLSLIPLTALANFGGILANNPEIMALSFVIVLVLLGASIFEANLSRLKVALTCMGQFLAVYISLIAFYG